MDKMISLILGALCGGGQFLVLRHTLKPLAEGGVPQIAKVMLLQLPIPLILLLGCAFINPNLLPFTGSAFCFSLIISGVANHLVTMKKKG